MRFSRPRGTQDIIPPEVDTWRFVERVFEEVCERYGYRWIRTPIIESTDLFVRAVGEGSDIVTKEMYTFTDRGGRSLTLRPENTASVIRAYLENGMHRWGGIQRLCYLGPMFRYDRPQAGRYRQFHQVGAEAIGSFNPALDVEMIQLVVEVFTGLGFSDVDVRLNSLGAAQSRGPYRAILLEALEGLAARIDPESMDRYRQNPMRIFDSKEYGDALKRELPSISAHLATEDGEHFARVKDLLTSAGVRFTEDPYLVRGLDYYTRTVFEVYYGSYGAQSALCGGGRYDDLVEECGGPATPAIGFSAGLERIVSALAGRVEGKPGAGPPLRYYVVCDGEGSEDRALPLGSMLRARGAAEVDFSGRSRKKQLQVAEKKGARFAVIVDAAREGALTVRDLVAHSDAEVAEAALPQWLDDHEEKEGGA